VLKECRLNLTLNSRVLVDTKHLFHKHSFSDFSVLINNFQSKNLHKNTFSIWNIENEYIPNELDVDMPFLHGLWVELQNNLSLKAYSQIESCKVYSIFNLHLDMFPVFDYK
jgi:hypothetical protein